MIRKKADGFALSRLALLTLIVVGMAAITVLPALAQTSGTWTATGSPNFARNAHSATLLGNGQVLIAGGTSSSEPLSSAELYNPATGKWTVTGSMSVARFDHTATLLPNGEVLVAGGETGGAFTAEAELYNPTTGSWHTTGSMTVPRAMHGAALLQNGQVLAMGGSNSDGTSNTSAELYSPTTGSWTATGNMSAGQNSPATLLLNAKVLVAGGDSAELFDPSTGQWTLTPSLHYGSSISVSTALLNNGNVLIYGNKFSCYAGQFYDSSANTWTGTTGQCSNSISHGPLTALANGKVLLAGAAVLYSGKSFATANCRLYDPATNTWSMTGSLLQSVSHTATRLPNGQVLAVGGSDAELYTP